MVRSLRAFLSYFTQACLLTSVLTRVWCSAQDDSDLGEQVRTESEYPQGLSRLLFKHMRFRDLTEIPELKADQYDVMELRPWEGGLPNPDHGSRKADFVERSRAPSKSPYIKRAQQELLVNKLAALLAETNKGKNSASTLRMPSLRFG